MPNAKIPTFGCDFGVLTVVDEARDAAIKAFGIPSNSWQDRGGLRWGVALVPASDGGHHRVVVGQVADRSNVPAFEAANTMLQEWRPRHVVVADIGGGLWGDGATPRDQLSLGDVIVANYIEYFEVEKQVAGVGATRRNYAIQLPSLGPRCTLRTIRYWSPNWHAAVAALREQLAPKTAPKILDGQIVCGEKLLSDPDSELVARLVKGYDKALGVDMESAGVGRAVLNGQCAGIFAEFTVLRGVSDYVDKKDGDNQQTRDLWKPYAAHVAILAVDAWVRSLASYQDDVAAAAGDVHLDSAPTKGQPVASDRESTDTPRRPSKAAEYLDGLREWLRAVPPHQRSFRLELRSTGCRAAASRAPIRDGAVARGEVLDLALHDRKVVVVGPSGAGKSESLRQIVRQLAPQDATVVIYIDLKENWRPKWGQKLVDLPDESTIDDSVNALMTASALAPTATDLSEFCTDHQVLLVVDALNEVPAEIAEKIRLALDQYSRFNKSVSVLASDRRTEQFYRESRWTVLHLAGVPKDEACSVVDDRFGQGVFHGLSAADQHLLCVPFFLDRALSSGRVKLESRATGVGDFLRDAGLDPDEIDNLANCAYETYARGENVIAEEDLADLEPALLDKVRSAGVVVGGSSGQIFSHQLYHQYLAGRHLGRRPELWEAETLDRVTAQAASLDVVGMTIASVGAQDERDRFLRIVFDWNWRAAVSALIETQAGNQQVSEQLATAVLAMAAEKRFDAVDGTRRRVEGLLREVPGQIAERMRTVQSIDQLTAVIAATEPNDVSWWRAWRDAFACGEREQALSESELAKIGSPEPLIGWTVANVLRRFDQTDPAAALLRIVYRSQQRRDPAACATRWRVVHALGAWPGIDNAKLLFDAFGDSYMWVVYGAVRSIVEMAARSRDRSFRLWIVQELGSRWCSLQPAPLSQIAWTAVYRDTDRMWPNDVRPLLEAIRSQQIAGERERWDRRLERFEEYANQR